MSDTKTKTADRFETFDVTGPEGKTVTIKRNIETGEQETGPVLGTRSALRVEQGQIGKEAFPPPMPEPVREPDTKAGPDASQVLPVSHEDVATPDEVKRRSRQARS